MIDPEDLATLEEMRAEIATLDARILEAVSQRLQCAEVIAERKLRKGLALRAPQAEESVLKRNVELGKELGLAEPLVAALTKFLIDASVHWQELYLEARVREMRDDEKTGFGHLPKKPQTH